MFPLLCALCFPRDPRTLYVDPHMDGDCFTAACSMKTAALVVRTADTIHFPSIKIKPTCYPSEFSDLFIQLSLMNTTVVSHGAIIDGTLLVGEMLAQITSHSEFTWTVFVNWTFVNFSRPILTRQYTWSSAPYVVFRDSTFENCNGDLFSITGGTIIFENCIFKNITGRTMKALSESHVDFIDCTFEVCHSLFFHGADASFINCIFKDSYGDRGGAIHARKSTVNIRGCSFVRCNATINGGAIYIRDSPENFETEITDSSFIGCNAQNGTDIYVYLSSIRMRRNCYANKDSVFYYLSTVDEDEIVNEDGCVESLGRRVKYIQDEFIPTDTNKWWQLDDLKPGSTIIIDDDDDISFKDLL